MKDSKKEELLDEIHNVSDLSNNTFTNPKCLESYLCDTIEEGIASLDLLIAANKPKV